jgi:hypothetical protein
MFYQLEEPNEGSLHCLTLGDSGDFLGGVPESVPCPQ